MKLDVMVRSIYYLLLVIGVAALGNNRNLRLNK